MNKEKKEKLAEYAHDAWAGWMKYLFSKCVNPIEGDTGTVVIPKWAVDRWKRQMNMKYQFLSKAEKKSDREEADKMIAILLHTDDDGDLGSRDPAGLVR